MPLAQACRAACVSPAERAHGQPTATLNRNPRSDSSHGGDFSPFRSLSAGRLWARRSGAAEECSPPCRRVIKMGVELAPSFCESGAFPC